MTVEIIPPKAPVTVRPLLSAVLERTKFWSQKPRIIEVRIIEV